MNFDSPRQLFGPTLEGARPKQCRFALNLARRRTMMAMVGLVVFGALFFSFHRSSVVDPEYRGRHLSEYVDSLYATYTAGDGGFTRYPVKPSKWAGLPKSRQVELLLQQREQATRSQVAIRAMGERSFPLLLSYLAKSESGLDRQLSNSPAWLRSPLEKLGFQLSPSKTYTRRWQAVTALRDLRNSGTDVSPVVPQLLVLAANDDTEVKLAARLLLRQFDRDALMRIEEAELVPPGTIKQ